MAKLKATPKNFVEAVAVLGERYHLRLGNNTYLGLKNSDPEDGYISVTLHQTEIVRFYADGRITLHTGGYRTTTTKERINQFINGRVFCYKGEWKIAHQRREDGSLNLTTAIPFEEGHRAA